MIDQSKNSAATPGPHPLDSGKLWAGPPLRSRAQIATELVELAQEHESAGRYAQAGALLRTLESLFDRAPLTPNRFPLLYGKVEDALLAGLGRESKMVRCAAARALRGTKSEACLEPLIGGLWSHDQEFRTECAATLQSIDDKSFCRAIFSRMSREFINTWQSYEALQGVEDPHVISGLLEKIHEGANVYDIAMVISALSGNKSPDILSVLLSKLEDESDFIRSHAVAALGTNASPETRAAIAARLKDPRQPDSVLLACVQTLSSPQTKEELAAYKIFFERAASRDDADERLLLSCLKIPEVLQAVETASLLELLRCRNSNICEATARALAGTTNPELERALVDLIGASSGKVMDAVVEALRCCPSPNVQRSLLDGLARCSDGMKPAYISALSNSFHPLAVGERWKGLKSDNRYLSRECARAIVNGSRDTAIDVLRKLSSETPEMLISAAAYALKGDDDPVAVGLLRDVAGSDTYWVKASGIEALAGTTDFSARCLLIRHLNDPCPDIRRWSADALGQVSEDDGELILYEGLKASGDHRNSFARALTGTRNYDIIYNLAIDSSSKDAEHAAACLTALSGVLG